MAWAAGLFEGEGTLSITSSTARYTRPLVSMTNTDPQITEFFYSRWGGLLSSKKKKQAAHHRDAWIWVLNSHGRIAVFLADLEPFWVSDRLKTKAALLVEDLAARQQGCHDDDYHDRCLARMRRMRTLNASMEPFLSHIVDPVTDRTVWETVREDVLAGALRRGGAGIAAIGTGR